jgi:hypothetical protein
MHNLKLQALKGQFSIHRLPAISKIPSQVYESDFFTIVKTDDKLSIVCSSSIELHSEKTNSGWSCLKVLGLLDFSITGILAKISKTLSESDISIFALSTYDTDYILVPSSKLTLAKKALIASGCTIVE